MLEAAGAEEAGAEEEALRSLAQQKETLFKTSEAYELVIGTNNEFPIAMQNPFNFSMRNVTLSVTGILSKYLSITPEYQLSLKPGEKAEYKVLITAPSYFIEGTHQLTFDISGKLVYGFVTEESVIEMERDVAYEKVITLKILEMDRKAAEIALINAQGLITDMRIKGYNVETVKPILALVEDAYKKTCLVR